ncbi:hypothetical protein I4U23_024903 [Adineta vaga]|nr:hypothetical protein I4U23_024903 [Adineta vaga]
MLAHIQFALVASFVILSQVSSQHQHPQKITCYTQFNSEETRIESSNAVLNYHYHQTTTTQYQTSENEYCSNVGCVCFSYQAVCRTASAGSNHVSQCTDADRHSGTMKWHRGWASIAKCEEMRQQPHTYHNLTCCNTDRCNNQPGKVVKMVNTPKLISPNELFGDQFEPPRYDSDNNPLPQRYDSYGHPSPQPMINPYKPQQHNHDTNDYYPRPQPQYDTHSQHHHYQSSSSSYTTTKTTTTIASTPRPVYNTRAHYSTTTRFSDIYKPNEAYDKSLSSNTSSLFRSFSNRMIIFLLISYLCNIVRFH